MTLNEVIMNLAMVAEHPNLPQLLRPVLDRVIEELSEMDPPEQCEDTEHKSLPAQRWIPCSERMPDVHYDKFGNWSSGIFCLTFDDGHMDIGTFNPIGAFEDWWGEEGPSFVGRPGCDDPRLDVIAWMPLPEPYKEEES